MTMSGPERKWRAILAGLAVFGCGGDASEEPLAGSNTADACVPDAMSRAVAEARLGSSACTRHEDCTSIGLPSACNGPIGRCPFPVARADYEAVWIRFDELARQYCEPSVAEACAVEKLSCSTALYCIEGQCEARIF